MGGSEGSHEGEGLDPQASRAIVCYPRTSPSSHPSHPDPRPPTRCYLLPPRERSSIYNTTIVRYDFHLLGKSLVRHTQIITTILSARTCLLRYDSTLLLYPQPTVGHWDQTLTAIGKCITNNININCKKSRTSHGKVCRFYTTVEICSFEQNRPIVR